MRAAKAAGAHEFITERLKDGYDTDVGTAGQLLRCGPIIVLDQPDCRFWD